MKIARRKKEVPKTIQYMDLPMGAVFRFPASDEWSALYMKVYSGYVRLDTGGFFTYALEGAVNVIEVQGEFVEEVLK